MQRRIYIAIIFLLQLALLSGCLATPQNVQNVDYGKSNPNVLQRKRSAIFLMIKAIGRFLTGRSYHRRNWRT
jgi:starvation-inducible outer membrane lipoprotein